MVSIDITKLSSKGQIVIPAEMRTNLKEGEIDSVKLVKFKTALLISPGNREWFERSNLNIFLYKLKDENAKYIKREFGLTKYQFNDLKELPPLTCYAKTDYHFIVHDGSVHT